MYKKTKTLVIKGSFPEREISASLKLSHSAIIKDIEIFAFKYSEIIDGYKTCRKNQTSCKIEISLSTSESDIAKSQNINTLALDIWRFEGVPAPGCEEISLTPDPEYTDEKNKLIIDFKFSTSTQLDIILGKQRK